MSTEEIREYSREEIRQLPLMRVGRQQDDSIAKKEIIFKVLDVDRDKGTQHRWPVYDFEDGIIKKVVFSLNEYNKERSILTMMEKEGISFDVGKKYKISFDEQKQPCRYSVTKLDDSNVEICRFTFE